jgi:hypothetical protein
MGKRMISTVMQLRLDWIYWGLPVAIILGLLNRARNIATVFATRPDNPFA